MVEYHMKLNGDANNIKGECIIMKMLTSRYELKGKTTYKLVSSEESEVDMEHWNNIISASPFMRRLGGSETNTKGYTRLGYMVIRNVSKSPDRKIKVVRTLMIY